MTLHWYASHQFFACLPGAVHFLRMILTFTPVRYAHAHQLCALLLGVSLAVTLIRVFLDKISTKHQ
jgi:hypothetical protein